jgi:hypothetical protein
MKISDLFKRPRPTFVLNDSILHYENAEVPIGFVYVFRNKPLYDVHRIGSAWTHHQWSAGQRITGYFIAEKLPSDDVANPLEMEWPDYTITGNLARGIGITLRDIIIDKRRGTQIRFRANRIEQVHAERT